MVATKLSLNSIMTFSSSKTLKMKGYIKKREVIIDCRATHNFIDQRIVKEEIAYGRDDAFCSNHGNRIGH